MLFEFYNQSGDLVLDNESHVLRQATKIINGPDTKTWTGFQHDTPAGWWDTMHSYGEITFKARILKNPTGAPNTYIEYPSVPGPERREIYIYDKKWLVWGRVKNGSGLCLSRSYISYFSGQSQGYYDLTGEGSELIFTERAPATDASGLFDCYNVDGTLMWSLTSLLKTPQILQVLNVSNGTIVNLANFPAAIKEKIYFFAAHPGSFTPPSYYSGQVMGYGGFTATNIYRENDLVYITNQLPLPGVTVLVGYIPD